MGRGRRLSRLWPLVRALSLVGLTLAAGCSAGDVTNAGDTGGTGSVTPPPGSEDDPESDIALAELGDLLFQHSAPLDHACTGLYPSALGSHNPVDVWITAPGAAAYARIDPDTTGSHAELPTGTMIIRQVFDANNQLSKLTLMYKAPPGYNPVVGDWWFGETDGDGVPLEENGIPLTGKLDECATCHVARTSDDYLFGVSASARAGG